MSQARADCEPVASLEAVELTILTCWAEAVGEALAASPDQLQTILDDARAGAPWRRQLGVAEPSADLASALEELARTVVSANPTVEAVLAAMDECAGGGDYGHLVRAVLRSTLESAWRGGRLPPGSLPPRDEPSVTRSRSRRRGPSAERSVASRSAAARA